jgi:hypothetical protein
MNCKPIITGVKASGAGLTLDAGEVRFLATRLRRLCKHFNFPLPEGAEDDAQMIGMAGSAIGLMLNATGVTACATCGGVGMVSTVEYADSMSGFLSGMPCPDCTPKAGVDLPDGGRKK